MLTEFVTADAPLRRRGRHAAVGSAVSRHSWLRVRQHGAWRLVAGGRELFAAPRTAVRRSFLFNHWYHHRGQLVVCPRLLDVPVPSVSGPTADENPLASA